MPNSIEAGPDYCKEQVHAHDIDRYLAILLAPTASRDHLYALFAFNLEVSKIRETVSEPLLGEIRLTWWKEAIEALYLGDVREHPVVEALERAIVECALPQKPFIDLIEARQFDLYDEPMETIAQFDAYSGATSSMLFQLAAYIIAGADAAAAAETCGHIGVAYALQGLLRAAPIHAAREQLYLPKEVMTQHKVEVRDYFAMNSTPALLASFEELHDIAHFHLSKAQEGLADLPKDVLWAFVPATLIKPYLTKIAQAGFDPFNNTLKISQFKRQWRMWRGMQKRKLD